MTETLVDRTRPATADTLSLEMHRCNTGISFTVTFEGPRAEDAALAYLATRGLTHARPAEVETALLPQSASRLLDEIYPQCEHGMSAHLCMGPMHFPSAEQERILWG